MADGPPQWTAKVLKICARSATLLRSKSCTFQARISRDENKAKQNALHNMRNRREPRASRMCVVAQ